MEPIIHKLKESQPQVSYFLSKEVLCCMEKKGRVPRVVLLSKLVPIVFKYSHDSPVGGQQKLYLVSGKLIRDIAARVRSCHLCGLSKPAHTRNWECCHRKWPAGQWKGCFSTMWDLYCKASQVIHPCLCMWTSSRCLSGYCPYIRERLGLPSWHSGAMFSSISGLRLSLFPIMVPNLSRAISDGCALQMVHGM